MLGVCSRSIVLLTDGSHSRFIWPSKRCRGLRFLARPTKRLTLPILFASHNGTAVNIHGGIQHVGQSVQSTCYRYSSLGTSLHPLVTLLYRYEYTDYCCTANTAATAVLRSTNNKYRRSPSQRSEEDKLLLLYLCYVIVYA